VWKAKSVKLRKLQKKVLNWKKQGAVIAFERKSNHVEGKPTI